MLNLVTALSNAAAYNAIYNSYIFKDWLTMVLIIFAALMSFISHLVENHKHNLVGFNLVSPLTSYILNRFDVFGVILLMLRVIVMYYKKYGFSLLYFIHYPRNAVLLIFAVILNLLSEKNNFIANDSLYFTLIHSAWHVLIFYLLNQFIIYTKF